MDQNGAEGGEELSFVSIINSKLRDICSIYGLGLASGAAPASAHSYLLVGFSESSRSGYQFGNFSPFLPRDVIDYRVAIFGLPHGDGTFGWRCK